MPQQPTRRQRQRSSTRLADPNPVSFRLDPHNFLALQQRAAAEGKRRNLWARSILLDALADDGSDTELENRIAALETQVSSLQQSLRLATEAIMLAVVTRKTMTAEEVRQWVSANLKVG